MSETIETGCVGLAFWERPVSRRAVTQAACVAAASSILPVFTPAVARATFGEDVALLIEQLQQGFEILQNSIASVQNLVQTVSHLSNVVQQGARQLKRATKKGGLKGIYGDLTNGETGLNGLLAAAANVTSIGQDAVGSLSAVGDLAYGEDWAKWQASPNADICAGKSDEQCSLYVSERLRASTAALRQADPMRIRSLKPLKAAFKDLKKIYDANQASMEAAADAQEEEGDTALLQIVARQNAQAMRVSVKAAEMAGVSAQLQTDEFGRAAAERENQHQLIDNAMKGFGEVREEPPVDIGYEFNRSQWGSAQ